MPNWESEHYKTQADLARAKGDFTQGSLHDAMSQTSASWHKKAAPNNIEDASGKPFKPSASYWVFMLIVCSPLIAVAIGSIVLVFNISGWTLK